MTTYRRRRRRRSLVGTALALAVLLPSVTYAWPRPAPPERDPAWIVAAPQADPVYPPEVVVRTDALPTLPVDRTDQPMSLLFTAETSAPTLCAPTCAIATAVTEDGRQFALAGRAGNPVSTFSPDGRWVTLNSGGGAVSLVDLRREVPARVVVPAPVTGASLVPGTWSPDSRWLLMTLPGVGTGAFRRIEAATGATVDGAVHADEWVIAVLSGGDLVTVNLGGAARPDRLVLRVVDPATGRERAALPLDPAAVGPDEHVRFDALVAPDGRRLVLTVTGPETGRSFVTVDLRTGGLIRRQAAPSDDWYAAAATNRGIVVTRRDQRGTAPFDTIVGLVAWDAPDPWAPAVPTVLMTVVRGGTVHLRGGS